MSGAGPVKKPSVGNPSKKATASRDSGRSNIHSGHKSLSRSLKTSDKDALHEDPRTRLTEFPSIAEEPASCSSPSMFSKLFGSGGGEVKRDGTKRQVEPARTNSVDSVSRNASGAEDAKAKKAVTNESGSSVSSLQRNTSVRRHSDAEESLRSIKGKNDRAIDAVLSKAFEANKEILSGESSRPPLSHRLHTPKRVHSSHWTEVTESTAEHYKVRQLLERMNRYSCLQGCKIFFGPSTYGSETYGCNAFEAIVRKPTEYRTHMHSDMTRTTIATGLGSSPLEAILDCEGGIEYYVSLHKGTWERIQDLLCLQQ